MIVLQPRASASLAPSPRSAMTTTAGPVPLTPAARATSESAFLVRASSTPAMAATRAPFLVRTPR